MLGRHISCGGVHAALQVPHLQVPAKGHRDQTSLHVNAVNTSNTAPSTVLLYDSKTCALIELQPETHIQACLAAWFAVEACFAGMRNLNHGRAQTHFAAQHHASVPQRLSRTCTGPA